MIFHIQTLNFNVTCLLILLVLIPTREEIIDDIMTVKNDSLFNYLVRIFRIHARVIIFEIYITFYNKTSKKFCVSFLKKPDLIFPFRKYLHRMKVATHSRNAHEDTSWAFK